MSTGSGRPERFDVEHSDGLFILDPAGRLRVGTVGMPSVGGRLSRPLRRLLNDQGRTNLHRPQSPWTPRQALGDLFVLKQSEDAAAARLRSLREHHVVIKDGFGDAAIAQQLVLPTRKPAA